MPKHADKYIAPHECTLKWLLKSDDDLYVMETKTETTTMNPFTLQMNLSVAHELKKHKHSDLKPYIKQCHELALEGFDVYFTDKIKAFFKEMSKS